MKPYYQPVINLRTGALAGCEVLCRWEKKSGEVVPPGAFVLMPFHNSGSATYRHPDPIEPTPLLVRWYAPGGALVREYRMRALLPLALGPREQALRPVMLPVPDVVGEHLVTIATAVSPDLVLSQRILTVRGGSPAPGSAPVALGH